MMVRKSVTTGRVRRSAFWHATLMGAIGCILAITLAPASVESLPANASTPYIAVIHFDRMDYVVENRYVRSQGIIISTSHAQGSHYESYVGAVANALDFVNLQFYFAQTNAMDLPTFKSRLAAYVNKGLKASQLRIGLPSYGMFSNGTNTADKWRSWKQMHDARVNLTSSNQWTDPSNGRIYHFSVLNLIDSKVRYAMADGFGGVFTWELTQDTNYNHALSINRRIDNLAAETPQLELDNPSSGGGRVVTGSSATQFLTGASTYTGGTRVAADSFS